MKLFLALMLLLLMSAVPVLGQAYELKLDANGCHKDGKYGKYHCHEGAHAGESFISHKDYPGYERQSLKIAQMSLIKMSYAGVCFTPDNDLYKLQKRYWTYRTLDQCLSAGGRIDGTVVIH